jgi:hypothetical protein
MVAEPQDAIEIVVGGPRKAAEFAVYAAFRSRRRSRKPSISK